MCTDEQATGAAAAGSQGGAAAAGFLGLRQPNAAAVAAAVSGQIQQEVQQVDLGQATGGAAAAVAVTQVQTAGSSGSGGAAVTGSVAGGETQCRIVQREECVEVDEDDLSTADGADGGAGAAIVGTTVAGFGELVLEEIEGGRTGGVVSTEEEEGEEKNIIALLMDYKVY